MELVGAMSVEISSETFLHYQIPHLYSYIPFSEFLLSKLFKLCQMRVQLYEKVFDSANVHLYLHLAVAFPFSYPCIRQMHAASWIMVG